MDFRGRQPSGKKRSASVIDLDGDEGMNYAKAAPNVRNPLTQLGGRPLSSATLSTGGMAPLKAKRRSYQPVVDRISPVPPMFHEDPRYQALYDASYNPYQNDAMVGGQQFSGQAPSGMNPSGMNAHGMYADAPAAMPRRMIQPPYQPNQGHFIPGYQAGRAATPLELEAHEAFIRDQFQESQRNMEEMVHQTIQDALQQHAQATAHPMVNVTQASVGGKVANKRINNMVTTVRLADGTLLTHGQSPMHILNAFLDEGHFSKDQVEGMFQSRIDKRTMAQLKQQGKDEAMQEFMRGKFKNVNEEETIDLLRCIFENKDPGLVTRFLRGAFDNKSPEAVIQLLRSSFPQEKARLTRAEMNLISHKSSLISAMDKVFETVPDLVAAVEKGEMTPVSQSRKDDTPASKYGDIVIRASNSQDVIMGGGNALKEVESKLDGEGNELEGSGLAPQETSKEVELGQEEGDTQ